MFCARCGANLLPELSSKDDYAIFSHQKEGKKCPHCSVQSTQDDVFRWQCGVPQNAAGAPAATSNTAQAISPTAVSAGSVPASNAATWLVSSAADPRAASAAKLKVLVIPAVFCLCVTLPVLLGSRVLLGTQTHSSQSEADQSAQAMQDGSLSPVLKKQYDAAVKATRGNGLFNRHPNLLPRKKQPWTKTSFTRCTSTEVSDKN